MAPPQVPRGTQNQEKGILGGTLGPSWGALGTQMGPRCEKDDFFGLSPPSPEPYFFIVSSFVHTFVWMCFWTGSGHHFSRIFL